MHFSLAIVLYDMEMLSTLTPLNLRDQGHFVTSPNGLSWIVCQHFQTTFSLKQLGQFKLKFICSIQTKEERGLLGPRQTKLAQAV